MRNSYEYWPLRALKNDKSYFDLMYSDANYAVEMDKIAILAYQLQSTNKLSIRNAYEHISQNNLNRICSKIILTIERMPDDDFQRWIKHLILWKLVYHLQLSGMNIFDFNSYLLQMFHQTILDQNLTMGNCKLPYDKFYLHFGLSSNRHIYRKDIDTYVFVEGVVIEIFTSIENIVHLTMSYIISNTEEYDQERLKTLTGLNSGCLTFGGTIYPHEPLERFMVDCMQSNTHSVYTNEALRPIFYITLNCLLYLNYRERDVKKDFPSDVNRGLVNDLSIPRKKERALAILKKKGLTHIFYCGYNSIPKEIETESGYELSPHWRRGHWRNQAKGKGRKEHELIWIRPMLVRGDKGEPQGHIYAV